MRGVDYEPGIVIPKKNCARCIVRQMLCLWKPAGRAWSCQLCRQLKKPCWRFEEMVTEGKWRAEGERGSRKRPRITAEEIEVRAEEMEVRAEETERAERSWKEDSGLLLGAEVARAIWQRSEHLSSVVEELAASQEAMVEELRLLCQVLVCNLRWIKMAFEGRGSREEEGKSEVEGAEAVEELERQVKERAE